MDFSQVLLDRTKAYIIAFPKAALCRCSTKEGLLKNLGKFTGKHLCRSFFVMRFQ